MLIGACSALVEGDRVCEVCAEKLHPFVSEPGKQAFLAGDLFGAGLLELRELPADAFTDQRHALRFELNRRVEAADRFFDLVGEYVWLAAAAAAVSTGAEEVEVMTFAFVGQRRAPQWPQKTLS